MKRLSFYAAFAAAGLSLCTAAEAKHPRAAPMCQKSLLQLPKLDPGRAAAARERIAGAVPEFFSGDLPRAEDALRAIGPQLKTESFASGSDFLQSTDGFPGVLIVLLEHKRTKKKALLLQPVEARGDAFYKAVPKGYIPHSTGNGFVLEHGGKTLLVSNFHVLEDFDAASGLPSDGIYDMDAAAIEIPRERIPASVRPTRLSAKTDEQLIGRPFFIPSIETENKARGAKSLVVTTGFVIPLPALFSGEPELMKPERSRQLRMHGGIHEDCRKQPRRGEVQLWLAGYSGSGVYDYHDRDLIGIFHGGPAWRGKKGAAHKITAFVSAEQLRKALMARSEFPRHDIPWVK